MPTETRFLDLIQSRKRGRFKLYLGMAAGVGKTYRMLQEAQNLLKRGVDVKLAVVVTHNRPETVQMAQGLPVIPERSIVYKGRELTELDLDAVIRLQPEVVVIDELAHTNVPGLNNEKRWQDVEYLLEQGMNVISAMNIQHLESLNGVVEQITGIGAWTETAFVNRFKAYRDSAFLAQKHPVTQGSMNSVMPWRYYAGMKEDDLKAIFAYLRTVPKINHTVEKMTRLTASGS